MKNPRTWNLWHGCHKCSEGCDNCYMFFTDNIRGIPEKSSIVTRTKDLQRPLAKNSKGQYKIPSGLTLSINMTSDTFVEEADEWRQEMWDVIKKRPDIKFYILTKRIQRVAECLPADWNDGYENVSINISVENQKRFEERWPILESIPAKHKGINLAPIIGPVDVTPALSSGQIDEVHISGEGFGGKRPCRYEWIEDVSRQCEQFNVNFVVVSVGSVYIKDGVSYESGSFEKQARLAFETGLSRFYGKPEYRLLSPYDRHPLSDEELIAPVFNRDECAQCPVKIACPGCFNCGMCKDMILVDADGNLIKPMPENSDRKKLSTMSLDEF